MSSILNKHVNRYLTNNLIIYNHFTCLQIKFENLDLPNESLINQYVDC